MDAKGKQTTATGEDEAEVAPAIAHGTAGASAASDADEPPKAAACTTLVVPASGASASETTADEPSPFEQALLLHDAAFRVKKKKGKFKTVPGPLPRLEAPVADTHAHLSMIDSPLALARCAAYNVRFVCCMVDVDEDAERGFAQLDTWQREAAELVPLPADLLDPTASTQACVPPEQQQLPHVRMAVGCHPHNAKDYTPALDADLRRFLLDPRTCALGEVGLDYHYNLSEPRIQRDVFRLQIRLAHEAGLPLILHVRKAHDDALAILKEEGFPAAGVLLHCCSLSAEALVPWLAHGCYIAYGGTLTFKNADKGPRGALTVPENRLLTETDAPYMTPEPLRGTPNGPDFTIFTAERMAQLFGRAPGPSRAAFLQELYDNAVNLLNREPTSWQRQR